MEDRKSMIEDGFVDGVVLLLSLGSLGIVVKWIVLMDQIESGTVGIWGS